MNETSLSSIDLNLLVAFDILMKEQSVSRAAEQLHLSQSATSRVLQRLRDLFDDPILVRVGSRMVPTSRATSMTLRVRKILEDTQALIQEVDRFEPALSERRFVVSTSNYALIEHMPKLFERISSQAPHVELVVAPYIEPFERGLETGEHDIVIGVQKPTQLWVESSEIFSDHFCLATQRGLWSEPPTLEDYADAKHVVVSPSGTGPTAFDGLLAQFGIIRNIAVRVSDFTEALAFCAQSPLFLTAPAGLVEAAARLMPISPSTLPFESPTFPVFMSWHSRFSNDPGNRWLRGLVSVD